jgi:uncharacterized protein (TIRG00374 family)
MRGRIKSWLLTLVKITIAVVGLWLASRNMHWNDQATIARNTDIRAVTFLEPVTVTILEQSDVPPTAVAVRFPDKPVKVRIEGKEQTVSLTGPIANLPVELVIGKNRLAPAEETGAAATSPTTGPGREAAIQIGLRNLVKQADVRLLLAAWAVLVVPFLVTAWRWQKLMMPQGIRLPYGKCLALTFVGQFYSTFLPGITGGDLVKIIYTSRVIGSKTKSTVTILLDRVIGLVALMVIAGVSAAVQAGGNTTMRNVALLIGAALLSLALGSVAYFSHRLRRISGLQALLNHRSMPEFVRRADEVLHAYRGAWRILASAFGASLIAQITLPLSAWLAGMAFGMNLAHLGDYLAYTPLATLAASVPLSPPAGFGVIEWVMFHFFHDKGLATVSQAFALAQAIRFLPILWNMCGAYWVVTGTYSRHEPAPEAAAPPPLSPNA